MILIKKKDILEFLVKEQGWEYKNILPKGRKDDKVSIALGLLRRDAELFSIAREFKPDIMLGTSAEITHIGKLLNIPAIVVNEDDFNVVPLFAKLAYPLANAILAPKSCRTGKWETKTIHYDGYHELAYLHPNNFKPDKSLIEKLIPSSQRYFILRFAKLNAHHDSGRKGIATSVAEELIKILNPHGNIFITSERILEPQFEKYRILLNPILIHHALFFADMYIGDSQTMAAEAAVLGTPSIRFNDFVGEIGYLEELEHEYDLTYGIRTQHPDQMLNLVRELASKGDIKSDWNKRRQKMINDKIDVTPFFVWIIENFPESINILKSNPDYQYRFRI